MDKIQKYPKTIGDYVKVKDYSKENSSVASDQANASANTTELNEALKNAVERVDSVGAMTVSDSSLKQAIKIIGTDGKEYLVKAMLWDKPTQPTIKADFVPKEGTRKTTVTSGACVSVEDAFKVTITHTNGGGKIYYTTGTTVEGTATPTTSSTQYSSEITFHPNLATERQDIVIKAIVNYTGQNSDVRVATLSFYRKIKLTLAYSPSNVADTTTPGMGGHSPMYFSAYGTVTASTNGANSPTWTNSKGGNTNSMTFYEDTPGTYWFKATESGWLDSDITYGVPLEIRHLRLFSIYEQSPGINSGNDGAYEPYKRFGVTVSGTTTDTNGNQVNPTLHYKITYSNPSRTDVTSTMELGITRSVSGNCIVSAWTTASGESGYPDWQGQSADKDIACRNLPAPTITYARTGDSHQNGSSVSGNTNQWASGMTFTVAGTALKDSDNSTAVALGLYYSSGNSANVNTQYGGSFTISFGNSATGGTIQANSVKAQRRVSGWTDSPIATAPSSNQVISKPHVYVGTYSYDDGNNGQTAKNYSAAQIDAIFTGWKNGGTLSSVVTNPSSMNYVHAEKSTISEIYNFPLTFVTGLNAPLIAYPKAWGEVKTITDGQQDYTKTYNKIECNIGGLTYYVYYFNTLGSDNTLAFNIIFN